MSHELWATYSVKDHLEPRTLAADIMLFDRLVFPVPETGEFPENSGSPADPGPVGWKTNQEEWARWEKKGWDPAGQKRLLDLLGPVSRKVSWDSKSRKHDQYRAEAAKLAKQELPDYAFHSTRSTLTRDLPAYVTGVAALGPAYRSVEQMERELGIGNAEGKTVLPGGALPTLLGWEFFTPDPDDVRLSPEELIKETVSFVTDDTNYKSNRSAFVDWQQGFLRDGLTDRESIERAVAKMHDLLDAMNKAATKLTIRKVTRRAFQLAPSALGLTAALLGIPGGVALATGGAFISVGGITVDEMLFKSAEQNRPPPAAFVHDVRRHFGWR